MAHQEDGVLSLFQFCPKCGSAEFKVNNVKSKKCHTCGFIYYLNPSAACAAFIHNANGDLLVATRSSAPAKGTFDLPGGFADMDETIEQAIEREIIEETGLIVSNLRFLFSLPNEYEYSGFIVPTMDIFFSAEVQSFDSIQANDDVGELQFIAIKDIKPELFGLNSIRIAVGKYITQRLTSPHNCEK